MASRKKSWLIIGISLTVLIGLLVLMRFVQANVYGPWWSTSRWRAGR